MSRLRLVLGIIAIAFLVTAPASAAIVNPGDSGIAVPGSLGFGDTIIASIIEAPFTATPNNFSGWVSSMVVQETGGNYDFYYQIHNNASSSDAIGRSTHYSFFSYLTDVYYRNDTVGDFSTGTIAPTDAARDVNGSSVSFNFVGSGIAVGDTTRWFFIRTDSTNYEIGFTSLIDGGVAGLIAYAPSTVPVPPSVILLGSGLLGLVSFRYRRRS